MPKPTPSVSSPFKLAAAPPRVPRKKPPSSRSSTIGFDLTRCRILTVSTNGDSTRSEVYRLKSRGGKTSNEGQVQVDNVAGIQLVDNTTEVLVINQFGTIIRIDTKCVRAAVRRCSSATPCHAVTHLVRS